MNKLARADLEVLLGAAVFPLKPLLEAEVHRLGQSLAHLPKYDPPAEPNKEEREKMIKESEVALYTSAAEVATAFLKTIREGGFYCLSDLSPQDQDWFEERAVAHLENLVSKIEDGLPRVVQVHYARERLWAAEFGHLFGKPVESHLMYLAPVRDNFRAGLRTKGGAERVRALPQVLEAFELKPNFFGLGFNLNFIIDRLWARLKRSRNPKSIA